jgi:hypothetical protein
METKVMDREVKPALPRETTFPVRAGIVVDEAFLLRWDSKSKSESLLQKLL